MLRPMLSPSHRSRPSSNCWRSSVPLSNSAMKKGRDALTTSRSVIFKMTNEKFTSPLIGKPGQDDRGRLDHWVCPEDHCSWTALFPFLFLQSSQWDYRRSCDFLDAELRRKPADLLRDYRRIAARRALLQHVDGPHLGHANDDGDDFLLGHRNRKRAPWGARAPLSLEPSMSMCMLQTTRMSGSVCSIPVPIR